MATIIHCDNDLGYVLCGIPGAFDPSPEFHFETVISEIILADPLTADQKLKNSSRLKNKIALVERGQCNFTDKYKRAVQSGAIALIIANNDTTNPTSIISMHGEVWI